MSTSAKEKELADKTLHPTDAGDMSLTVTKGIQGIIEYTKTKAGLSKVLADDHARHVLTTALETFISIDVNWETGMQAMGECLTNLIEKQGVEMQRKALSAICDAQKVAVVELDEKHPRMSFAAALFARFPDMHTVPKGSHDSRAAQRISAYMAAFKAGSPKYWKKGNKGGSNGNRNASDQPRTAPDCFLAMWNKAAGPEQEILVRLAERAKIDYKRWIPEPKPEDGGKGTADKK